MGDPARLTLRSTGPEETRELAAAAASVLRPGDVVSMTGELGAGKTCFVQGVARGIGVTGRVTSPTFLLVRTYDEGRLPIVHCDVYRLDRLQDVYDLGDDVMSPDAVTFLEWGDAVAALLPDDRLEVELTIDVPDVPDAPDVPDEAGVPDGTGGGAGEVAADAGDAGTVDAGVDASDLAVLDGDRVITLRGHGAWVPRLGELAAACARWTDGTDR